MKKHKLFRWKFGKHSKQLMAFQRFEGEGATVALDRLDFRIGGNFGMGGIGGNVPFGKGHRGQ